MVSRKHLKFIKSLQHKKYRKQAQSFIVEGEKSVVELIHSNIKIKTIIATKRFLEHHFQLLQQEDIEWIETSKEILNKTGTFQTNQTALAVATIPEWPPLDLSVNPFIPVYEYLQDPGNLGTILRICDWFGIDVIILSSDSVDVYSPKVIQASMGSFTRVKVYYKSLDRIFKQAVHTRIGTTLEGENVHGYDWPDSGMILFGNESRGISGNLLSRLDHKISIPKYGGAESLNVAITTGIILDHMKRHQSLRR
jgi:TrmH family RNA methyltransferase